MARKNTEPVKPSKHVLAARAKIRDSTKSADPAVAALAEKMLKGVEKDEAKEAKGIEVERP